MKVNSGTRKGLRAEIDASGYFPELVEDSVLLALGDEELIDFVVHHAPTFSGDEIHRHVTVLALTPTRLIVGHTDDHPADPPTDGAYASASTESIRLTKINNVVVTRVVARPEHYHGAPDAVVETWLTIGWGAMNRLDLEPAGCNDPNCEADHGYTGNLTSDDLTVRISAAIEGSESVARLVQFATNLQRATS
ncbi:DUF5998 family protein [Microlunatus parietis]|uniref:Phosphodiesterase n=1 Tax=Microlunatus parietis TaxID=682979 RepID=A0A7Y9IEJ0_9ACTN|nr:DUF5998 family protein [Microlunatus parietis]NYE75476.1 hypothetical protein [Microlunatus parietis]